MSKDLFLDNYPQLKSENKIPYNFIFTKNYTNNNNFRTFEEHTINVSKYKNDNHYNILSIGKPISKIVNLNEKI